VYLNRGLTDESLNYISTIRISGIILNFLVYKIMTFDINLFSKSKRITDNFIYLNTFLV